MSPALTAYLALADKLPGVTEDEAIDLTDELDAAWYGLSESDLAELEARADGE